MTSKEALEQIKRDGVFINNNGEIDGWRTCEYFSDYCNKIKQDLERLEELKKENQELKEQLKLTETARQLLYNELKCCNGICNGISEYAQKLENIIQILKDKVSFEVILNLCDDEEKEALKEVLGNEMLY